MSFFKLLSGLFLISGLLQRANSTDIAIYYGPGAWLDGIVAFEKFCEWKGLSYSRVTPLRINSAELFPEFTGIYFPGGDAYGYKLSVNNSGLDHIRNLINQGGFYIGVCAGSYFACDSIEWEGGEYDYPLDLFNGWARGAIDAIAPWADYTMTEISFNPLEPVNYYSEATATVLYYGGPVYEPKPGQITDTLATWNSWGNLPAIVSFLYGSGRVLFIGPHPEIEEDDDRDGTGFANDLSDIGSDWPWLWSAVDWVMNNPVSHPYFWINEFHYDNTGSDANESVEIVTPAGFTDYQNLHLTLYDGLTGHPDQVLSGPDFLIGNSQDGYTIIFTAVSGIRNDNGGLALDYRGQVIQFLSYEGTFTALSGVAEGLTSTDIGQSETEIIPENFSLQLSGNGKIYGDFFWAEPAPSTWGSVNSNAHNDQSLPVSLLFFMAQTSGSTVYLEWLTASELHNLGFILERNSDGTYFTLSSYRTDPELQGHGTSAVENRYRFTDETEIREPVLYRLYSVDYGGSIHFLKEIKVEPSTESQFRVWPNTPNPFNDVTRLQFFIPEAGRLSTRIFNTKGELVRNLQHIITDSGVKSIQIESSGLASGLYFHQSVFTSGSRRSMATGKFVVIH